MPSYKVKGTDILHSKTIYPEGSTIELTKVDAARLEDYLEFISAEPEIPADEVKQEEVKAEEPKQEEIKQEEVKPSRPARSRKPQPKPAEIKKEPEVQKVSETTAPAVQQTPATAITEVKTQEKAQVPPAAQKVIANVITQVNSSIHNTTAQSYQPSLPTNMRSA